MSISVVLCSFGQVPPTEFVLNGTVDLSWVGNPQVSLQSTTNLTTPNWLDVTDTAGFYSLPISVTEPQEFFRLKGP